MCAFKAAADARLASKWNSAVRVGRSGAVLEPASGAFDMTVAPGENVQAAVDACPPGGSVLLLPGTHEGPLVLTAGKVVHVFGRGRATLRASTGAVVTSEADTSTMDGLVIRREAPHDDEEEEEEWGEGDCVWIKGGRLRLQACDVTGDAIYSYCVVIEGGADPVLTTCKCVRVRCPLFPGLTFAGVRGGQWPLSIGGRCP